MNWLYIPKDLQNMFKNTKKSKSQKPTWHTESSAIFVPDKLATKVLVVGSDCSSLLLSAAMASSWHQD